MTAATATADPPDDAPPLDGVPALPLIPHASPANVRRVWLAARDLAAEGEAVTAARAAETAGVTVKVAAAVKTGLVKAGCWPAPRAGRKFGPRLLTQSPPKPVSVPREPRAATARADSASDASDRVLGHSGGLAATASPTPEPSPLALELINGTLSAALSHLGPHLSDRNRLALEMCLEVLR